MLVKFRFWTTIYLLLELPSYKYHLKINFLNSHNRITNINVAADPTAKDCSTKLRRTFTPKFSKTAGVSKNKLGRGEEKDTCKKTKRLCIFSTSHFSELYSEFLLKYSVLTATESSLQNSNPYTPMSKVSLYSCLSCVPCTLHLAEYRRIKRKYKCWHRWLQALVVWPFCISFWHLWLGRQSAGQARTKRKTGSRKLAMSPWQSALQQGEKPHCCQTRNSGGSPDSWQVTYGCIVHPKH